MRTCIFMLVLLCGVVINTKAQEIAFDLKKYQTPDYSRAQLDLDADLREAFNANDYANQFNGNPLSDTSFNFNFNLHAAYRKVWFSREKIETLSSQLAVAESFSNRNRNYQDETQDVLSKSQGFTSALYFSYFNNNYLRNERKAFVHYGGNFNLISSDYSNYQENMQESNGEMIAETLDQRRSGFMQPLSAALELGFGIGRLEHIGGAVEAIYILDELQKTGNTLKSISESEVTLLADKIIRLNEQRYFDSRIYRRMVMRELTALLMEEGIIDDVSVETFNTIADYHFYAGMANRTSGSRLLLSLNPRFSINSLKHQNEQQFDYAYRDFDEVLALRLDYVYQNPISIKWQSTINAFAEYNRAWSQYDNIQNEDEEYDYTETNEGTMRGSARYTIGYYPDTRTYLSANAGAEVELYELHKHDEAGFNVNASLGLSGYYYLSDRLRFNGAFSVLYNPYNHRYNIDQTAHEFGQSLTLSFTYHIF